MNSFPCYQGGQDCPRRAPGCHAQCDDYKKAAVEHQARKDAARVPEVCCYNGDRRRAGQRDAAERRHAQLTKGRL